jgi:Flp pilus assembly protein TadD/septal ring factor EnvC (AmiA/AmiB activator)
MKQLAVLSVVLILGGWLAAGAEGPDDQFIRIYNLIQQADALRESGQGRAAQERYLEAQAGLLKLEADYPKWNEKIINYRKSYLTQKLAALGVLAPAPAPAPAAPAKPAETLAPKAAPDERENQINFLNDQIKNLKAERDMLEAKLREALSAQPAAVDPRELAKAEDRIKDLQKENDLLKVNVAQQQEKLAKAVEPATLAQAQAAVKDANTALARQTQAVTQLTKDRQELEQRLKKLTDKAEAKARREEEKARRQEAKRTEPAPAAPAAAQTSAKVADLTGKLQRAEKELTQQKSRAEALAAEKAALAKRVAELAARPVPAAPPASADAALTQQLQQARKDLAQEKLLAERLGVEKAGLEKQLAALSTQPRPAAPPPAAPDKEKPASESKTAKAAEKVQLKQLEKERDELRKRVAVLSRQLEERQAGKGGAQAQQLAEQLASLRARVEVYEARSAPYSPEELALFKLTAVPGAKPEATPLKKAAKRAPAGAAMLMAEARRAFDSKRFDEAEKKFQEVLKLDEKNVGTLTDLAAAQLELNRLDDAEATLKRALAGDPYDGTGLSLLGYLRFKQQRYDDALETLSKAAQLDADNAVTQNYLGIVLGQKGQRQPAETALRKAIQLQPGYAEAHHNLGLIYATQKPPYLELARWHYQKALEAGHPRNADLEKLIEGK